MKSVDLKPPVHRRAMLAPLLSLAVASLFVSHAAGVNPEDWPSIFSFPTRFKPIPDEFYGTIHEVYQARSELGHFAGCMAKVECFPLRHITFG